MSRNAINKTIAVTGARKTAQRSKKNAKIAAGLIGIAAMVPFGAILAGCENQAGPRTAQVALTGTVSITGTPRVGETLTVTISGNGAGNAVYQWKRDGVNIAGAAGAAYTLVDKDDNTQISVTVTFPGYSGSITSDSLKVSETANAALAGTVSIDGTPELGKKLTANISGITNASGTAAYQWRRGAVDVGTNSSEYLLTAEDLGGRISVTVTFRGYSGSLTSAPVTAKPELTGTVSITGTPKLGETLTAVISGSNGAAGEALYQWKRGDVNGEVNIAGAAGSTYTLVNGDSNKQISVTVTFPGCSGSITSGSVTVMPEELTGTVSITGTLAPGHKLTAAINGSNGTGTALYKWKRAGVDIAGANESTYDLVMADGQKPITVEVTFPGYSGSITSDLVTPCYIMYAQTKVYQDAGVTDSQMNLAMGKLSSALTPWGGGVSFIGKITEIHIIAGSKPYTWNSNTKILGIQHDRILADYQWALQKIYDGSLPEVAQKLNTAKDTVRLAAAPQKHLDIANFVKQIVQQVQFTPTGSAGVPGTVWG
jgi:hypothetical protein